MASLQLFLAVFMLLSLHSRANAYREGCTVGEMYGNYCYLLVSTPASWENANLDCIRRGGTLATINNINDNINNNINDFLANIAGEGKERAWIGATDAQTEGVWKWSNGVLLKFTSWGLGQPRGRQIQNCVEINFRVVGKWNDEDCQTLKPYICQEERLVKSCNGADHGISCCYKGFSQGDDDNDGQEEFIQADQYNMGCFETCKKLHPNSIGITESVKQQYQSGNGTGRNKCWCEFGTPKLNQNPNYQTCVFTIPSALSRAQNDPVVNDCVSAGGSFFGHEGGRIKAISRINVGEGISITLSIKPKSLTGMLVGVKGPKDYCFLELVDGKVVFRVENGIGVISTSFKPNIPLDDGNFHQINAVKSGNMITMAVDKLHASPAYGVGPVNITATDTNNPLFIGGHDKPDRISSYPGTFQGCIKDVFIDNNKLDVTSDMVYGDVAI